MAPSSQLVSPGISHTPSLLIRPSLCSFVSCSYVPACYYWGEQGTPTSHSILPVFTHDCQPFWFSMQILIWNEDFSWGLNCIGHRLNTGGQEVDRHAALPAKERERKKQNSSNSERAWISLPGKRYSHKYHLDNFELLNKVGETQTRTRALNTLPKSILKISKTFNLTWNLAIKVSKKRTMHPNPDWEFSNWWGKVHWNATWIQNFQP